MRRIYLLVIILILFIPISIYYIQTSNKMNMGIQTQNTSMNSSLINQTMCDELLELESSEFKKLDTSCKFDEDCILIPVRCGLCVNKDADTMKYIELYSTMVEKGCVPVLDCLRVECTCSSNKCETKVFGVE